MEIYGIMLNRSEIKQPTESFSVQEFFVDCSEFDRFSGQKKFENKQIEELMRKNKTKLLTQPNNKINNNVIFLF